MPAAASKAESKPRPRPKRDAEAASGQVSSNTSSLDVVDEMSAANQEPETWLPVAAAAFPEGQVEVG